MSTALDLVSPASVAQRELDDTNELGSFVEREIAKRNGQPVTLVLVLPAAGAEPRRLLDLEPGEEGFLWVDDNGESWSGLGVAHRLDTNGTVPAEGSTGNANRSAIAVGQGEAATGRAPGEERFARLRRLAHELASRVEIAVHPDLEVSPRGPRLFGGAAFCPEAVAAGPWSSFGDASFVLPRWAVSADPATVEADAGGRTPLLWLALDCGEPAERAAASGARVVEVLSALRSSGEPSERRAQAPSRAGARSTPRVPTPATERWIGQVEEIRRAIAEGRLSKVVAARSVALEVDPHLSAQDLFFALEGRRSGCSRFLFRRASGCFLGATPERLVNKRGREVTTHALAGSIERGAQNGGSARELLASQKDQFEHRLVVDHLVDRLSPLCESLDWSETPIVRQLREVLHLETPMAGRLSADLDVLDLVSRLHPTPAVGGVPVEEAVRWIVEREERARGWYSGPVGWFDLRGDGDFVVALRSVLLDGSRALAYVGAGIVAGSDPIAEFDETELKLRALRSSIEEVSARRQQGPGWGAERPERPAIRATAEVASRRP